MHPHQKPPPQAELPLDHTPALDRRMRELFETRWCRWHRCKRYEDAIADPVTKELLSLAAQHLVKQSAHRGARRRGHE